MFEAGPVLSVNRTDIYQESKIVLESISFDIQKDEFCYLIGRTGSGKSSLLKTLYADLPLINGTIQIAGYDLSTIKEKEIPFLRRKLGIVFQDFQLFPDRTVADNITFVMQATGWKDKGRMKAKLAEVLMRVGLGSVAGKYPHQLSGGEQQRVVIARSLVNDPAILLADEPTGNLDPDVSAGIFEVFKEINHGGTAILMATHNYDFLSKHNYRILKCENGQLFDSGKEKIDFSTNA